MLPDEEVDICHVGDAVDVGGRVLVKHRLELGHVRAVDISDALKDIKFD